MKADCVSIGRRQCRESARLRPANEVDDGCWPVFPSLAVRRSTERRTAPTPMRAAGAVGDGEGGLAPSSPSAFPSAAAADELRAVAGLSPRGPERQPHPTSRQAGNVLAGR